MHVAVVNLTGGGFSGGYRKYLRTLLPLLAEDARVSRLTVCSPATGSSASESIAGVAAWSWPAEKGWRAHRDVSRYLRKLAPDVVLIPTARWIDAGGAPTAVMVRNMEPLVAPFGGNAAATAFKNIVRRRVARSSCKRADRVFAVSHHVSDFLESAWHMDAAKIGLVYHGVSAPLPPAEARAPARAQLEPPTLFTAGSIRPARGLEDVIRATAMLRADGRATTLLIAGGIDADAHGYADKMKRLCARLGIEDAVQWAGQLADSEMSWCFYNARIFVMTTRAEACPNTALEAMAHGALSVAGNNPPMPEIFAGAADHYDIGNAASLAAALRRALDATAAEQAARRERARTRAMDFSWQATAHKTIDELEKCTRMRG